MVCDTGILWTEARNAIKHPAMYWTAPHNKVLSSPTCQFYQGWEILLVIPYDAAYWLRWGGGTAPKRYVLSMLLVSYFFIKRCRDLVLLKGICKLGATAELFRTMKDQLSILWWKGSSGGNSLVMVGETVTEEGYLHPVETFGQFGCKDTGHPSYSSAIPFH